MPDMLKDVTVGIKTDTSGFDEVTEKMKRLRSLLQEVKDLAASLEISITFDVKED